MRTANAIWQAGVQRELRQESRRRWVKRAAALGAMLALGTVVASQAHSAGLPCGEMAKVAESLKQKYNEAPVAFGIQINGNLLQVYSSEEQGTWTVVSTTPKGVSCILAVGKGGWERLLPVTEDPLA